MLIFENRPREWRVNKCLQSYRIWVVSTLRKNNMSFVSSLFPEKLHHLSTFLIHKVFCCAKFETTSEVWLNLLKLDRHAFSISVSSGQCPEILLRIRKLYAKCFKLIIKQLSSFNSAMIWLTIYIFAVFFVTSLQAEKSANFKFSRRSKQKLPAFEQHIMGNRKACKAQKLRSIADKHANTPAS